MKANKTIQMLEDKMREEFGLDFSDVQAEVSEYGAFTKIRKVKKVQPTGLMKLIAVSLTVKIEVTLFEGRPVVDVGTTGIDAEVTILPHNGLERVITRHFVDLGGELIDQDTYLEILDHDLSLTYKGESWPDSETVYICQSGTSNPTKPVSKELVKKVLNHYYNFNK